MLVCFHRLRGAAWQNFVIHSEFIFKLQTIFHILIKGKNALVQFLNVSKATHSRCYLMAFFSLHWNWVLWANVNLFHATKTRYKYCHSIEIETHNFIKTCDCSYGRKGWWIRPIASSPTITFASSPPYVKLT